MAYNTQAQNQDSPPQRSSNLDSINSVLDSAGNVLRTLKQTQQLARLARLGSAASGLIASFPVWGPIAAIVLVIIITIIIIIKPKTAEAPGDTEGPDIPLPTGIVRQPEVPGLTIEKSADPTELPDENEETTFTTVATYVGTNEKNIIIKDPVPSNAELISASGNHELNADKTLITWKLDPDVNLPTTNPDSGEKKYTFTLTVKPKENNINIDNTAYGESAGATPTTDMCLSANNPSRLYVDLPTGNPAGINFGDPACTFAGNLGERTDKLGETLNRLDSVNKTLWLFLADRESSYSPNAYNGGSSSGKGAYGLMQMNPNGKGNNQYDAGDVVWENQIENAINYNKLTINNSFCYWEPVKHDTATRQRFSLTPLDCPYN
ncbi:MAG: hypothetical protein A3F31_03035 [Candidatus Levybacteria bacterium RIFCSPHIGHO2_12_FULL_38_12]|nr:MAG: hypothetical protein A2770_01040 [Candidatus Levybacteria bacterium RIFCSPHIGHO2_01_FULL_38_12]OGH22329.1 MAG: hypothetical protein A3D75_02055 [Candidatus Levybacteria bacterium RIFCSPHIGHO2_02_FULL_37_18]OGH23097.1 MAG: hypothetical protein A3F31_03035 [Candidatus Levybacteria bacterium RIFCSPHIGHO2_12_FULL_38_12]OGH33786.1 MAG: hypothetical protein A3A47_01295 [Candidatus Levybacteria bacterium RIFCSPLOWO2_01_FULL_37_20]OGH43486.1 MAG: hypothetical protein A3J14_01505 [Candidatus Lev